MQKEEKRITNKIGKKSLVKKRDWIILPIRDTKRFLKFNIKHNSWPPLKWKRNAI